MPLSLVNRRVLLLLIVSISVSITGLLLYSTRNTTLTQPRIRGREGSSTIQPHIFGPDGSYTKPLDLTDSNPTPTSYVLAESYWEQQTSGCGNLQNLQCWANKYDMLVVEPFVEDSLLGAPLDTMNATTLKFSGMFDMDSWNTESSEKGNSKLVPWDTFLQQAPHNLIVVVFAYWSAGGGGPQMTDTSKPRYLQGCSDENHWPNEHQMNVLVTHKFNVVRRVCFNFQYKDHLTLDNFYNAIFGDYGHENVTVFFREWRSATVDLGDHRIFVKGGCSRNWLEESMQASRQVIKEAELYAHTYLSSPNGNGGYIAIMARLHS